MGLEAALLSLEGLAVGDAFGQSLYTPETEATINQRLLPAATWHWTDDTQMALSVVEELRLRGYIDQDYLSRRMAWRYKTDPARGYGKSTRYVLGRIAQGEYFRTVSRSVYNGGSYGSSGAARTAPLGAFFAGSLAKAAREAPLAAAITHLHPESLAGAQAVAAAAAIAAIQNHPVKEDFLREVLNYVVESRVHQAIQQIMQIPPDDPEGCLKTLFKGDFSTVQTAVPFALWCAAHHLDDYKEALWTAASWMGNRDTTCAIVGGIVALANGQVPADWLASREPLPSSALITKIDLPEEPRAGHRGSARAKQHDGLKNGGAGSAISVRVDPLTGLPDLLGLLDYIDQQIEQPEGLPFNLIVVHLVPLWDINRSQGRTSGDNLIRECAKELQGLGYGPVFRIGGDKLVVIPEEKSRCVEQARQIAQLVTRPGCRLPRTALIHFPYKEEAIEGRLMACLVESLKDHYYKNNDGAPREFDAPTIRAMPDFSWMMVDLADQMRKMGQMVDEAERLSQTDVVSQLPNLRMAMMALEDNLKQATDHNEPMAILILDGDNLRRYNQVSYEAGDEAIRLLGSLLKSQIRQTDFVARWRTGDEFLIILPDTTQEEAIQIGHRVCAAVEQESRGWLLPSTISGGIAVYPKHGPTLQDLLHSAEVGLKTAKENGKNQVVVGEELKF